MEYFTQLKANGWKPIYSKEIYAISQLRKLVYFLSTSISMEALDTVLFNLNIGYVDVKGNTPKEKIIFIINYCQENNLLLEFYEQIFSLSLVPKNYIDKKRLNDIPETNLKFLSFDIPNFASCSWEQNTINGERKIINCHKSSDYITIYRNKKQPCEKIYRCNICGEVIDSKTEHDWNDWKYISANSCDKERICKRCGYKETIYADHEWSKYYKTPNNSQYRICLHCHLREYDIKGKWQGYVYWNNGTKDLWQITFYEKTILLFIKKHKAIIDIFTNVNTEESTCKSIVKEKCNVDFDGQKISIKGRKVLTGTNYILDNLDGSISADCLTIEGIVSSKNAQGKIKLEQLYENQ